MVFAIRRSWSFGRQTFLAIEELKLTFNSLSQRTWHDVGGVIIMLVRAPITFGHSQLKITYSDTHRHDESTQFKTAAGVIEKAIGAFNRVLTADTLSRFSKLAVATNTQPPYIKTLVLKASANEDLASQYKVHLVPYFGSHEQACTDRYARVHCLSETKVGGLLGWLGVRETEVDGWQEPGNPDFRDDLEKTVIDEWQLDKLATALKNAWPDG